MLRRIAIVMLGALGFVACRPGEGDYCRCPDECRRGLVCAQSGAVINACIDPAPGELAGRCIEADGASDMVDDQETTVAAEYHDVGGKRDFEPGTPGDESSDGTATSTATETSTSTGTSTSGATSSTGTSTSSGSTGP